MTPDQLRQQALKIINKDKWWDILSRFIEVLRINIFIVDTQGLVILPPEEGRYGGKLLTDPNLGFDLLHQPSQIMKQFTSQDLYLESLNRFNLYSFAIPIQIDKNTVLGYMVVGPVILNKKLDTNEYDELAKKFNVKTQNLLDEIDQIRVLSNIMMRSILDLLAEIIKDNVELSIKSKNEQIREKGNLQNVSKEIERVTEEIYSTVRLDELLVTFLDVALKMTNTECGSIMLLDEKNKKFTIKVSRGIDKNQVLNSIVKLGEGIAGIAAKENSPYFIKGQMSNNRIAPLLKRPEIKESLVMPINNNNNTVIGVLSLHTKQLDSKIENNVENLKYLSKLLTSAI